VPTGVPRAGVTQPIPLNAQVELPDRLSKCGISQPEPRKCSICFFLFLLDPTSARSRADGPEKGKRRRCAIQACPFAEGEVERPRAESLLCELRPDGSGLPNKSQEIRVIS